MKKLIIFLLFLSLVLGLAACDVSISDGEGGEDEYVVNIDEALELWSSTELQEAQCDDTYYLAPAKGGENSLYGYINLQGEWVISPTKKATVAFNEGYGMFLNGYSCYDVIDRSGKIVFEYYGTYQMEESNHLQNGMVACCLNNGANQKYVYLNSDLKTAIKAWDLPMIDWRYYYDNSLFGFATAFNEEGLAVVMRQRNSDCYDWLGEESAYVINKSGAIKATLPSGLDPEAAGIDNLGNIIVKNTQGLYGLCSKDGKLLIECKYKFIRHCEGNLYLICNDIGFLGFIDENDNNVIPCQYQKAYPFSEGLAAVYDGAYWGFIDESGNTVIEFVFDDVLAVKANNIDANTGKGVFCEGCAIVSRNGYWGVINNEERPVVCFSPEKCEGLEGSPFVGIQNGYIVYKQLVDEQVLYGVLNTKGQLVLKPQFEYLGMFN